MITFNHEEYIEQAIRSVLSQDTAFSVELVISDDCSTDDTRRICERYARSNPEAVKLLPNRERVTAIPNFIKCLCACSGKYIALCEGDDYWTDQYKLKRQVEVLEARPDCVACHHWQKYAKRDQTGKYVEFEAPTGRGQGYLQQQIGTIRDIFANRLRIKTRTVMYRNILDEIDFPPGWLYSVPFGDVPLSMIMGEYGDFYFIDEPMAVYRQTGKGVSTMGPNDPTEFYIRHHLTWVSIWDKGNAHARYLYNTETRATVAEFFGLIFQRKYYSLKCSLQLIMTRMASSEVPLRYRLIDIYRISALLYQRNLLSAFKSVLSKIKRQGKRLIPRGTKREGEVE